MINMSQDAYSISPDTLVMDSRHPLDVKVIKVTAKKGTLKRGTVISSVDTTEDFVPYGTTVAGKTTTVNCVVAEDVEVDADDTKVDTVVYISGSLNKNALIVAAGTISLADIEKLRSLGIFVSSSNN